jgi:hypothetical protein
MDVTKYIHDTEVQWQKQTNKQTNITTTQNLPQTYLQTASLKGNFYSDF